MEQSTETTYEQAELPFPPSEKVHTFKPFLTLDGRNLGEMQVFDTEEIAAAVMFANYALFTVVADSTTVIHETRRDAASFTAYVKLANEQAQVLRGGVEWI
jgi:hypothetical protein